MQCVEKIIRLLLMYFNVLNLFSGPNRSNPTTIEDNDFTCILCQEEEELKVEGKALVTAAFLQKSTVLSNHR